MNTHAITIQNLTVAYRNTPILWNINLNIPQGTLLAVVGPNGAGKTTLIKAILGLVKPAAGVIRILQSDCRHKTQHIAYVPQRATIDWDFPATAFDVVLMGRYPHMGWLKRPSTQDYDAAHKALAQVDMTEYADRHISQLSGGQQQRIFLARALAQDASIYLMDEPFIGIDSTSEKTMIGILKELRTQGKTIVVVHHDLHTLQEYFDWLLLLNIEPIAYGPVSQVFVEKNLHATYGNRLFMHNVTRKHP